MSDATASASSPRTRRRWSFPIARVAGIELRVHVTFFLLVPLFAFAGSQPGGPGVVGGLVWLVVIFGCVVLHELGHCFVARQRGVGVHEIDLLPIGGVSRLERLPESGRDEFAIAIAGPIVSVGLSAVAAIIAVVAGIALTPVDWFGGAVLPRLVWFNLLIGAFNLLPAFPLDGGRVLRALLERRHDLEHATRIATRVGRRVAIAIGVLGLFLGPLLIAIAIFIYFGASTEEAATIVHIRLERRTVGAAMLPSPSVVHAATSVDAVRSHAALRAQRAIPVVLGGRVLGVVSLGDLEREPAGRAVGDVVVPTDALAPTDELELCLPTLLQSPARALAVVDTGRVAGVLRVEDVQHLVDDAAGSTDDEESGRVDW
jgi:stage IV sporulation protein FB